MELILRAILGLSFLMLVLTTALFIPAGTLSYWQAWGYLGVFGCSALFVTVWLIGNDRELLARRVKAGPIAETRRSERVIQSVASILFLGLFVVSSLDFRFGWTKVPGAIVILCDALVAFGFVIIFAVFRANRFTSATIEVAGEQRVVESGPYAFVRHPMYSGAVLLILATPPALASWAALPLSLGMALVVIARIFDEERFLSANLTGYKEYLLKVRYRLVPYVW